MKKLRTRALGWLLALSVLAGLTAPAMAEEGGSRLKEAVGKSASYILEAVQTPQVGATGGEWAVLGLARSGVHVPQEYWDRYYSAVETYVKERKGVLHERKYTEYSRLIAALTAIGADPTDVAGYDLLVPLGDYDKTVWQGLNGPIWALLALDSGSYDMPVNAQAKTQATRQMYIDRILECQLPDGGWNLSGGPGEPGQNGGVSDPDITGTALQALAKYQEQSAVKQATERALACMSRQQNGDGGFASWSTTNLESSVQMLVALCELGISVEDSRFVKNGSSILDNVLSYSQSDGSFRHTDSGAGNNQMASEQGLYGLAAAMRAAEGMPSLYRMSDVAVQAAGHGGAGGEGLPGKHTDVKKMPVTAPDAVFMDIAGHANQEAIQALASRGILSGKGEGRFDPDATMTRAEFAAAVTGALGLPSRTAEAFADVSADQWYAPYVGTAYVYGLISGTGDGQFTPQGTITRQEAAVMVAAAAALCGLDTEMEDAGILNVLAQFPDYITVAPWARPGVAFCYRAGILDQSDLNVEPARAILRCEIAQMLYNLLGGAGLL